MRAHRIVWLLCTLCACSGPEASDAAVCADVIHRVCAQPVCPAVTRELDFAGECEPALLTTTGCGDPSFVFSAPTRERFLQCRAPLLRRGSQVDQAPACEDVDETFVTCPDVVTFLNGGTQ